MSKIRIVCFIGAFITGLFLPFWYFVAVVMVYAIFFTPYELLVVALCIDAQFGEVGMGMWYRYTLAVTLILVVTYVVKPRLSFYQ